MSLPDSNIDIGNRYQHIKPQVHSEIWQLGKERGALALERYHYLCASIQGKYKYHSTIPPDLSTGQYSFRRGFDFSSYTAYRLQPIFGIKLEPLVDGTVHAEDLKLYHNQSANSWKHSEGGILYNMGDEREFYNCILNYHSSAKTTDNKEWDEFFEKLKESGFQKGLVPCMYFAQKSGCWDSDRPFLHDEEMFRERRNKLLETRRKALGEPTPKQRFQHMQKSYKSKKKHGRNNSALSMMNGLSLNDLDDDDTEDEETKIKVPRVRHFCANPECMKPWLRKDKGDPPLRKCAKCQWTYYCSATCQKTDRRRHKSECAPADEVIANDMLWSPIGTRKGTETFNTDWGDA